MNENAWTEAEISMSNTGGIRTGLEAGIINYAGAVSVLPFENRMVIIELRGDKVLEALEYSIADEDTSGGFRNFLHYTGMKVTLDYKRPPRNRVVSVKVLCRQCEIPVYEPLDVFKKYRIIMPEFLANGGDGFFGFQEFGEIIA